MAGDMMKVMNLNERAWTIADDLAARADELRIAVQTLPSGARVLDGGIDVRGGYGAGIGLAELCMGGLGHIRLAQLEIGGIAIPGLEVWTDHPAASCMASQYAGWALSVGKYFAMASGPLRAHARVEKELFDKLEYAETAKRGVLVLEGRTIPTEDVVALVAQKSALAPSQITFAIAPTASLAGGVQVVARILETGLHKMEVLGFDVRKVVSGVGTAPLPTLAKNDLRAIGRTNDCILYGGQTSYLINATDAELTDLAAKMPASSSNDYGTPFYETFKKYDGDFYKIDKLLFSPAEVWLTSATTGNTFHGGLLNLEVLRRSLLED
ncbi:MAG: methenyltetrahydromethanopterin cyclohydrolase [Gemmatimonadota bacterium]|nr:methenyltetrahydromethanopterin cyclohydrolase [Gemmatimonadota bacterium]